MFTSRVRIIILLLFIAGQRSRANPTTAVYPLETPPEQLKDHGAHQKIYEEGKGPEAHWDCQPGSDYIQEQISITTKMLSEGKTMIAKQKDMSTDEIVLVLGKAGSGKTSLVQFLTQNPKLQGKEVSSGTSEYIIEDGERIGTSVTESFTLYPEIVDYNNSSISFCDSPGFHDSRSSAHEIVSMDVMKSVTSKFKKVKILLLENYSVLQHGISKDSFMNTLRHLIDFLGDIDRYKDHIVLIATKIPLKYITTDDINVVSGIVTEEMFIESIMKYLNQIEMSIAEKLNLKIGRSKQDFYQNAIKILQSLQTRDKNGKSVRINVFRRPYKSGSLLNMPLLEKNKESLAATIMSLDFIETRKDDFDFTLSNEAKIYLECLLKLTSDNYKNKVNELSFKLNQFITQKTQNYTFFYQMLSDMESLYNALKDLSENLDQTRNYNNFFKKINGFISDQKISLQINYNERIHVIEKYEEMLSKFADTNLVFNPTSWSLPIRQVMKSAEEKLQWYKSLDKFISGLGSYKTQKNKTEIYSTIFHEGSTSTIDLMNLFVGITGDMNMKQFIDSQADPKRRLEVESIANTLLQQSNITCDTHSRLVVKGFQIRISEINSLELASYCNNKPVKEIALHAVCTVFLDEDTTDIFRGVNLFIAAPKWEVIGQRQIVLSGKPGPRILDDEFYVNGGIDGRPGLPGGNGGNFFGVGLDFLNGNSLRIESNGGEGGPGADGAKGANGSAGRDASEKLKLGIYNRKHKFRTGVKTTDLKSSLSKRPEQAFKLYDGSDSSYCYDVDAVVEILSEEGDCGNNGSAGGLGGEAGFGGFAGDLQLIELNGRSQIEMKNQDGSLGARGKQGEHGERGLDGIGMICVQVSREQFLLPTYWKCESTNATSPACNYCQNLNENIEFQYTTTGIELPTPKTTPDFSYYLLDYTALLERHINHTIFNMLITEFRAAIQTKFSYSSNDMGLLLLKGVIQTKS